MQKTEQEKHKRLQEIGERHGLQIFSIENYPDYLHDETFLKGNAHSIFFAESHEQVIALVKTLHQFKEIFPEESITIRGRGSGLSGAAVPCGGIVLALEKMDRVLQVDSNKACVHAQAGVRTAELSRQVLQQSDFTLQYPVDVSSAESCSIGGNIATNASGPKSYKYGSTLNYLQMLRVVFADGSDAWLGTQTAKNSSGLNMLHLFAASEGRLGIITEVKLKLVRTEENQHTLVCAFENYQTAAEIIVQLNRQQKTICALELIDEFSLKATQTSQHKFPPFTDNTKALIILELEGAESDMEKDFLFLAEKIAEENIFVARDEKSRRSIWLARKNITEKLKEQHPFKLGEDFCVPVSEIPALIKHSHKLSKENNIKIAVWGHAGQGNLHINFLFESLSELPMIYKLIEELAHFTLSLGGTLSGEHGLGNLKKGFKKLQYSSIVLEQEKQIKKIYDPDFLFNKQLEEDTTVGV